MKTKIIQTNSKGVLQSRAKPLRKTKNTNKSKGSHRDGQGQAPACGSGTVDLSDSLFCYIHCLLLVFTAMLRFCSFLFFLNRLCLWITHVVARTGASFQPLRMKMNNGHGLSPCSWRKQIFCIYFCSRSIGNHSPDSSWLWLLGLLTVELPHAPHPQPHTRES